MGNNPSSQAGGHPRDKANAQQQLQSIRQQQSPAAAALSAISSNADGAKRHASGTVRGPTAILPTTPQGVAPPAASLLSATGSTAAGSPASSFSNTPTAPISVPLSAQQQQHQPSAPVDVPSSSATDRASSASNRPPGIRASVPTADLVLPMSQNSMTDMTSYLARPPRLPLRIEEEEHTPGSPILPPALGEPVGPVDGVMDLDSDPSSTAKSSSSNIDSDGLLVDKSRPMVPTRLVWRQGGERVYVTGTPFQWNRKLRMNPVNGKPGCFSVTIPILPGTHHIRFLVDNKMRTSENLPTTVDFGNNLVNYIEVSTERSSSRASRPKTPSSTTNFEVPAALTSSSTASVPATSQAVATEKPAPPRESSRPPRAARLRELPPRNEYTVDIPQYLADFDMPEDSEEYMYAVSAIEKLSSPPALPGFLGKPILNASPLHKDDNSVLVMPIHSVLNHLATISIKNGVLGVCATTRYRHKCITTIMYKPTNPQEG
ncbi:SNF1 protein kinase subunit beta-3 [Ceratocystis platani]|uniref:SNF1 protein kinase subunit beta-3 n=1 Tax=Ceratocystis fimbriata f. sp. platani TaxID=88771 RepID=A0A0F8D0W2_CERFI|nr:SNF1 protein kinase subunit beta-3 [Ceratocystis platani]